MKINFLILIGFLLGLAACQPADQQEPATGTLIIGPTLINPDTPVEIIDSAFVYFKDNKIIAYGQLGEQNSPAAADTIEAYGQYLMPGLIDGFATLNNQAYANAYLYKGITTILEVDGYRRGPYYPDADPAPGIYRLESVGETPAPTEKLLARVDSLHQAGFKVALMMYGLQPDQARAVYERAKSLGLATIGELGHTTYKQGMDIGIDAFVHTTRYSLDVAPRDMAEAVANEPFSNDLNSPKWRYYKYLTQLSPDDPALQAHARNLAASDSYIMPTMSLSYLDLPEAQNPWDDPVAAILDPQDINRPADPQTGRHSIPPEEQEAYTNLILAETSVIEPTYYRAGAKYLAGSATDVWGTMPGISLHTELMLLHTKPGLSIAETLAAATVNFNKAFGWPVGKIAPGFEADMLLLNRNPLDDLTHLQDIDKLFNNGRLINRDSLLLNYRNHD